LANYGKWLGGALGWAVGGPIGGALGFFMGMMFDDKSLSKNDQERVTGEAGRTGYQRYNTSPADFAASLLVLSAAIMKSDGRVLKSELNFVRDFFVKNFGEAAADEQMLVLREVLKQDLNTRQVCEQIRYHMEHPNRLLLLQYLFGIALADGEMEPAEVQTLRTIAHYMGISNKDFESLLAMFSGAGGRARRGTARPINEAYTILEIAESVDDAEVKRAYRRMATKYHPDKNRGVGETHQKMAEEKFIKVQEAYEQIKEARGIK
jgi:DnaJ like chaperone protein